MNVELIYDADCPNVADMRSLLIKAFTQTDVSARWREWERSSPDTPGHARAYGSPTILVDGNDIAGIAPDAGIRACRVYSDEHGNLSRVPPLETICLALLTASREKKPAAGRWQAAMASLPAVGTAFLPKLTCPLCFPAYAAILSALGLEFVNYTPYLPPLTAAFLVVALAVLGLQTRRTGNIIPLLLGIAAASVVLIGKFGLESDWLTTGGVVLLVVAIFFGNRGKSTVIAPCPACAAGESEQHAKAH
ncbi:MAG: MerC domain-containing protein [Betaproteobacteria bacterium]|nr:MerC domain-containing protein [Betaproteobacteria bacterium]